MPYQSEVQQVIANAVRWAAEYGASIDPAALFRLDDLRARRSRGVVMGRLGWWSSMSRKKW